MEKLDTQFLSLTSKSYSSSLESRSYQTILNLTVKKTFPLRHKQTRGTLLQKAISPDRKSHNNQSPLLKSAQAI